MTLLWSKLVELFAYPLLACFKLVADLLMTCSVGPDLGPISLQRPSYQQTTKVATNRGKVKTYPDAYPGDRFSLDAIT